MFLIKAFSCLDLDIPTQRDSLVTITFANYSYFYGPQLFTFILNI